MTSAPGLLWSFGGGLKAGNKMSGMEIELPFLVIIYGTADLSGLDKTY